MAISANTVWEIRATATASNANGGGFVTGASGTDYSQQDAAQYNLTGVTTAGADAILLSASAAADMVGNIAYISAGTNFTTGRYEIIAVSPGVSITLDRTCTSGAGSGGVVAIGGALSLQHSSDDSVFEALEPGNTAYIKQGTYTQAAAISISKAGTGALPIKIIGYASTRGDNPTGSTRPTIATANFAIALGNYWQISHVIISGSAGTTMVNLPAYNKISFCKIIQTTTTSTRVGLAVTNGIAYATEVVAYRCNGLVATGSVVNGCYIHDCNVGLLDNGTIATNIMNNIFAGCVTYAAHLSASENLTSTAFTNNTFVGFPSNVGKGIYCAGSTGNNQAILNITNNIFTGFVTAIENGVNIRSTVVDYNNFYDNTTDVTNVTKGNGNIALDPAFSSYSEITGSTATTSGSVLTQSGADFSNVEVGRDYLYLVSGTGVTAGIYGITNKTTDTLTLDIAPGTNATADKVFKILVGRNFATGAAMRDVGFPSSFPGGYTDTSSDLGASQAQASSGGGGSGVKNHIGPKFIG